MPSQSKRRRLSILTLPFVVAIAFLIMARLAAWQRSGLVADMTECITNGETRGVKEALHKLTALPSPPISMLVNTAASNEQVSAVAAQVSIDRLMDRWERDLESKKRYGTIAGQLSELAKSLAETRAEFSQSDHPWLATTVRKILLFANKFPPTKTPLVAVHCDATLTSIGTTRLPEKLDDLPKFDVNNEIDGMPDGKTVSQPGLLPLLDSDGKMGQTANRKALSADNALTPYGAPVIEPPQISNDDTAGGLPEAAPTNVLRDRNGEPADDATSDRLSSTLVLPQRSDGAPPIFRILPTMPRNVLPNGEASNYSLPDFSTAAEGRAGAPDNPLASTNSRELLKTWLASENRDIQSIERELAKRGFGKLSKPLVQQFFSENPQERIGLVDHVLAQPGGGSEVWLLLLASDADPDVRLFAVTCMATSNNAALVEKAWQVAIRDRDPRVADLAGRLRERREGPLRR